MFCRHKCHLHPQPPSNIQQQWKKCLAACFEPLTSMLLMHIILPAQEPATCTASMDVTGTPMLTAATYTHTAAAKMASSLM
jgi:hypothetical protein